MKQGDMRIVDQDGNLVFSFPHCDQRILHPPGECKYCDESGLHQVREAWGMACTGKPEEGKTICPADLARSKESQGYWPGNRPATDGRVAEFQLVQCYLMLLDAIQHLHPAKANLFRRGSPVKVTRELTEIVFPDLTDAESAGAHKQIMVDAVAAMFGVGLDDPEPVVEIILGPLP